MSDEVCFVFADVYQNVQNDQTGRPPPLPKVPGFFFKNNIVICML